MSSTGTPRRRGAGACEDTVTDADSDKPADVAGGGGIGAGSPRCVCRPGRNRGPMPPKYLMGPTPVAPGNAPLDRDARPADAGHRIVIVGKVLVAGTPARSGPMCAGRQHRRPGWAGRQHRPDQDRHHRPEGNRRHGCNAYSDEIPHVAKISPPPRPASYPAHSSPACMRRWRRCCRTRCAGPSARRMLKGGETFWASEHKAHWVTLPSVR